MINDTVVNKFTHLMNMITENLKIKNGANGVTRSGKSLPTYVRTTNVMFHIFI